MPHNSQVAYANDSKIGMYRFFLSVIKHRMGVNFPTAEGVMSDCIHSPGEDFKDVFGEHVKAFWCMFHVFKAWKRHIRPLRAQGEAADAKAPRAENPVSLLVKLCKERDRKKFTSGLCELRDQLLRGGRQKVWAYLERFYVSKKSLPKWAQTYWPAWMLGAVTCRACFPATRVFLSLLRSHMSSHFLTSLKSFLPSRPCYS